jgi:4-diphosphocytidyl-2-C-methyl-D-erythritol kinase
VRELELFSPCKINLFFKILGKRPDGYHEVVSHMQALDFGDKITFSLAKENRLHCLEENIPKDQTNLIFKALQAFNRYFSVDLCLDVHLSKNVPIQSGLGGGAGNAATTLYALRELSGIKATDEELAIIAGLFSSDGSFFFSKGSAICYGRGEKFINAEAVGEEVTLVWPNYGVSTPKCYRAVKAPKFESLDQSPKEKILFQGKLFENDLETPAFSLEPRLEELKEQISQFGFKTVLMTGSGSCFYALGHSHSPLPSHWNQRVTRPIIRQEGSWYENRNIC